MLRTTLYLVAVAVVSIAVVWLAAHPGSVTVAWEGTRIDTSLAVAGLALAIVALLLATLIRLWGWLAERPRRIAENRIEQRRRHGYRALTHGLVAAAAGDVRTARNAARSAEGLLGEPQLTTLLAAQAAQLEGDDAEAKRQFTRMLDHPETEFLGVRGLLVQAEKRGDGARARALAERAFALRPGTPWVQRHLLGLQSASGDWNGALRTVDAAVKSGTFSHDEGLHHRAIFLYEQAVSAESGGDRKRALALARDAHDRDPAFVPATVLAARLLAAQGRTRQAKRIVELSWTNNPHPGTAEVYAALDGDDAMKRLKRLEHLVELAPDSAEGRVAAAAAALDAEMWGRARGHLEAVAATAPSNRVFRLLARLEEAEHGDLAAAREWLLKAAVATPDPAWTCERCGTAAADWTAHCTHCGAFDSLTWRSPATILPAIEAPAEAGGHPVPATIEPETARA